MKQLSEAAQCAKLIRQDLKRYYPNIKFSVRSENYSMGNSVNVRYTNGVNSNIVEKLLAKYSDGKFDGMIDLYEYSPNPRNLPRTKYLFINREVDEEIKLGLKYSIASDYGFNPEDETEWMKHTNNWSDQNIWKELQNTNL